MDDAVSVVAQQLFGDAIDPRELSDLISKMDDQSEMHVNRGLESYNKKRARKNKQQAQVGLAGNVIGLTAGGAALMAAGKDKRLNNAGKVGRAIQAPYKLASSPASLRWPDLWLWVLSGFRLSTLPGMWSATACSTARPRSPSIP
jgi:hypothetical protein